VAHPLPLCIVRGSYPPGPLTGPPFPRRRLRPPASPPSRPGFFRRPDPPTPGKKLPPPTSSGTPPVMKHLKSHVSILNYLKCHINQNSKFPSLFYWSPSRWPQSSPRAACPAHLRAPATPLGHALLQAMADSVPGRLHTPINHFISCRPLRADPGGRQCGGHRQPPWMVTQVHEGGCPKGSLRAAGACLPLRCCRPPPRICPCGYGMQPEVPI